VDAAVGGRRLVAIDGRSLLRLDVNGIELGTTTHGVQPVAVAVDPAATTIYLLDAQRRGFLRFDDQGAFRDEIGSLDDVAAGFAPRLLAVHPAGNLFVSGPLGSPPAAAVHEFAPDGSYVGSVDGVSALGAVLGIAFDRAGQLYVGSPMGIARFGSAGALVGNPGTFYSATLDNGAMADEGWHRLDLIAELDAGGAIDLRYASSSDTALVAAVDGVFRRQGSAAQLADNLEALLGDRWKEPHRLRAAEPAPGGAPEARGELRSSPSHSVLFAPGTERYLWLKLELSGLTPRASAVVREMRVCYPRISYLRYLPATYQEDRPSREFLERFLSLFETVLGDLETTIGRIPEVFTPSVAPAAFLDWLARWLDLSIEEEWTPEVKRQLIERASRLYEGKGTPEGLADFIEVVLGQRPLILESFTTQRPLVVGETGRLGHDTRLEARAWEPLLRGERTVLNGITALGSSRLSASARRPVNPYRASAYRFTVVLRLSPGQLRRHRRALDRIIREHAPAHVEYDVVLQPGGRSGRSLVLGVNATLEDPPPMRLGLSALGGAVCTRSIRYGPELERDAVVSGEADAWCRASACS
jgi:phage tail-like protein